MKRQAEKLGNDVDYRLLAAETRRKGELALATDTATLIMVG